MSFLPDSMSSDKSKCKYLSCGNGKYYVCSNYNGFDNPIDACNNPLQSCPANVDMLPNWSRCEVLRSTIYPSSHFAIENIEYSKVNHRLVISSVIIFIILLILFYRFYLIKKFTNKFK